MKRKFKKMSLSEKKGFIKQKEFEMQRNEYERQILELKKQNGKQKASMIVDSSSERSETEKPQMTMREQILYSNNVREEWIME